MYLGLPRQEISGTALVRRFTYRDDAVELFLTYSAIGFGGDYAVGLFAQDSHAAGSYVVTVDPVDVDVQVDPEVVVDVRVRHSGDCSYELDREVSISASAAAALRVDAGSGSLRIEGRRGLDEVQAVGRVCASHEEFLEDLRLTLERVGRDVVLSAHYPDSRRDWRVNRTARIDLTVLVPLGMDLDIDDSSGGIEIEDVAGDVEIRDGSGGIDVRDVQGTVRLNDGSGGIDVAEVEQDVIVEDDGSGSIEVRSVGGDLIVHDDGSGSIRHSDVQGRVEIPADKRERRRGG